MRCTATKRDGTPCQKPAMHGHEVCQPHSGGQVGRQSKLTDDVQQDLCAGVQAGLYLVTAARRAGVSEKTVYAWLRRGREADAPPRLAAFVAAFERAEAEAEASVVVSIRRQIAGGDARLGLEFLSRRHPERWGKNRPVVGEEPEADDEPQPGPRAAPRSGGSSSVHDARRLRPADLPDEEIARLEQLYAAQQQPAVEER
jgi:hypothetical protein